MLCSFRMPSRIPRAVLAPIQSAAAQSEASRAIGRVVVASAFLIVAGVQLMIEEPGSRQISCC